MNKKVCIIAKDNFIYRKTQEKLVPDPDIMLAPHAPVSVLTAARGSDIQGGTAYMTFLCCPECMKALGAAEIKKIVYQQERPAEEEAVSRDIADYFEIELVHNPEIEL